MDKAEEISQYEEFDAIEELFEDAPEKEWSNDRDVFKTNFFEKAKALDSLKNIA